jgi:hypothetical protein
MTKIELLTLRIENAVHEYLFAKLKAEKLDVNEINKINCRLFCDLHREKDNLQITKKWTSVPNINLYNKKAKE